MTETKPLVVLVDDHRDDVVGLQDELNALGVEAHVTEPEHLSVPLMEQADVFLLDMFLTDWRGRNGLPPAAQVWDGIALAGVIRGHAREAGRPLPIIALHTGHPDTIAELPYEIREHALARAHNLEWVFLKAGSASALPTSARVAELAHAKEALPARWNDNNAEQQLLEMLAGTQDELASVLECWPPIREVGRATAGIAVLRWLLHRILPYPCFLLDERHVAARLGLTLESFRAVVDDGSRLAAGLADCAYKGILDGFDGHRWWRQRIESMLWDIGSDYGLPASFDQIQTYTSTPLSVAATPRGVVVLDADYQPREDACAVGDAVRIRLDDWPPYAEEPWAAIADAQADQNLRQRVLPLDRGRLDS